MALSNLFGWAQKMEAAARFSLRRRGTARRKARGLRLRRRGQSPAKARGLVHACGAGDK